MEALNTSYDFNLVFEKQFFFGDLNRPLQRIWWQVRSAERQNGQGLFHFLPVAASLFRD